MSGYIPKVGDVVARRDRQLDPWDSHQLGYSAHDVLKVSSGGQRVTIRPRGRPDAEPVVLTGGKARGLIPMTAAIEAEMRADDAWLTARSTARALGDRLRQWSQKRKGPEEVDRLLNTVEPLRAMMEHERAKE